ncbi:MAG: hypothetical protein OES09_13265, partial [Gammaproteobacteria bacterium]|nr:hypothetical protein [Gammaproteobacteria bacterium]
AYEHDGLERTLSVAYMALCCTRTYQLRRMDSFWNFSLETEKLGTLADAVLGADRFITKLLCIRAFRLVTLEARYLFSASLPLLEGQLSR